MAQQAKTNIQQPPRALESLDAANEYLWQLYRGIALEPRILGGQVVLEGAAVSVTVELEVNQGGLDYIVLVNPVARAGSPAANSDQVSSITKEANRFTATFKAAPGAGNSIKFDWLTRR